MHLARTKTQRRGETNITETSFWIDFLLGFCVFYRGEGLFDHVIGAAL